MFKSFHFPCCCHAPKYFDSLAPRQGEKKNVVGMVISRNAFERKSLLRKAYLVKENSKFTSKIIAKTIKEINCNSKFRNGNSEEFSNIFRDKVCRLHEIELIMTLYANPFHLLPNI
jgi:hypothetical protein